MNAFFAVAVLTTGALLVCSVPVLVVAQRRERLDVSRRFLIAAMGIGLFFGASAAASDRLVGQCAESGSIACLDFGFTGLLFLVGVIYVIAALAAAVHLSRE